LLFEAGFEDLVEKIIVVHVDEKIQSYASSLDKSQKNEDDSLGVLFAQKVKIKCE